MKTTKIIILVVVCIAFGYFLHGVISQQDISLPFLSKSFTGNPVVVPRQAVQPVAPQTIVKKVGESFTLGDMEYRVLSATNNGSTSGFRSTTGKYIEVIIKATNTGKTEIGLSKIYLRDSNGRQYEMNVFASGNSKYSWYGQTKDYNGIPAGFSETFSATFEVPKGAVGLELDYPSVQGPVVLSVKLGM